MNGIKRLVATTAAVAGGSSIGYYAQNQAQANRLISQENLNSVHILAAELSDTGESVRFIPESQVTSESLNNTVANRGSKKIVLTLGGAHASAQTGAAALWNGTADINATATSIQNFMTQHNIQDIEIDLEFPDTPEKNANQVRLLDALAERLGTHESGDPKVSVGLSPGYALGVQAMNQTFVDLVNNRSVGIHIFGYDLVADADPFRGSCLGVGQGTPENFTDAFGIRMPLTITMQLAVLLAVGIDFDTAMITLNQPTYAQRSKTDISQFVSQADDYNEYCADYTLSVETCGDPEPEGVTTVTALATRASILQSGISVSIADEAMRTALREKLGELNITLTETAENLLSGNAVQVQLDQFALWSAQDERSITPVIQALSNQPFTEPEPIALGAVVPLDSDDVVGFRLFSNDGTVRIQQALSGDPTADAAIRDTFESSEFYETITENSEAIVCLFQNTSLLEDSAVDALFNTAYANNTRVGTREALDSITAGNAAYYVGLIGTVPGLGDVEFILDKPTPLTKQDVALAWSLLSDPSTYVQDSVVTLAPDVEDSNITTTNATNTTNEDAEEETTGSGGSNRWGMLFGGLSVFVTVAIAQIMWIQREADKRKQIRINKQNESRAARRIESENLIARRPNQSSEVGLGLGDNQQSSNHSNLDATENEQHGDQASPLAIGNEQHGDQASPLAIGNEQHDEQARPLAIGNEQDQGHDDAQDVQEGPTRLGQTVATAPRSQQTQQPGTPARVLNAGSFAGIQGRVAVDNGGQTQVNDDERQIRNRILQAHQELDADAPNGIQHPPEADARANTQADDGWLSAQPAGTGHRMHPPEADDRASTQADDGWLGMQFAGTGHVAWQAANVVGGQGVGSQSEAQPARSAPHRAWPTSQDEGSVPRRSGNEAPSGSGDEFVVGAKTQYVPVEPPLPNQGAPSTNHRSRGAELSSPTSRIPGDTGEIVTLEREGSSGNSQLANEEPRVGGLCTGFGGGDTASQPWYIRMLYSS